MYVNSSLFFFHFRELDIAIEMLNFLYMTLLLGYKKSQCHTVAKDKETKPFRGHSNLLRYQQQEENIFQSEEKILLFHSFALKTMLFLDICIVKGSLISLVNYPF